MGNMGIARLLQRASIKRFLTGIIGLLVISLLILSANTALETYWESQESVRMDMANELADHLVDSTGYEAKERGFTTTALSLGTAADGYMTQKIEELRAKGDEAFMKANELSKAIIERDETNTALVAAVERANAAYAELMAARTIVDRNLVVSEKTYTPGEWIKAMTAFIDANSEVRLSAFASHQSRETLQEALRMNLELKQAVWLMSEYAGRERATVGGLVGTGRPMDSATIERLNTFRAIVDISLKPVMRLRDMKVVDPEVIGHVEKLDEIFLKKFQKTREAVYAAATTGDYPISGKEWLERATEGIDTILELSASVGKMVSGQVTADLAASKRKTFVSVAVLLVVVCLGAFAIWVINSKVVAPMQYLKESMQRVEETGDLTGNVEVSSEDENGQIAATFNNMMAKFHGIIREIHSSTELLASSSDELSASAVQIAGGTRSQSAKASQVSTSAQELSASIIDVAKNVSGVSEAAKEANTVAVKGGQIVTRTIKAMNGISGTARESSRIIATLGGRSDEIGNIINVIDDIADQTNLLALNAAIEAARAGEQGRGFAVVADEVRKLAEKTMKATKEIGSMIKAMQDETKKAIDSMEAEVRAVEEGVMLAQEADGALREILAKGDVVTSMVHHITTATEQQSAATGQISGDIESVVNVIDETSSSAQQIARASEEIAELALRLKSTVEMFRIEGAPGKAPVRAAWHLKRVV
ncbi:MAG TPA: hypothetical protein DDW94_02670 [Deltaproteobacteria bacterium]|nr:MAG: hypothetical protein A2Z79_09175 [Deltaproteobacteria bacterium GWA2_55_82]OGQ64634.1 MAG: hypothetical protein A3I81_11440 [Deltaproteobacteria bacterium RIFCSPLOWO2_02_FULL_55_12]OIJ73734.1 MAG: hypothetical protein A2V21_305310 [Deltaproteobacteria bacterium GWC2_55_46]HBG45870.1 hypothetical protein [Deltaproteobacteria bacterium]HCY09711.1 hypothetical protein [Deltaproteobacteria bacterium]